MFRTSSRHASRAALALASTLLAACGGANDPIVTGATTAAATPASTTTSTSTTSPTSQVAPAATPVAALMVPTLVGRASLAADSFVAGPTSGQYITGGDLTKSVSYGYRLPFVGKQPIQGFSAVADGPLPGCYYAMQDNGFGGKGASPDALLHIYAVLMDWTSGKLLPADFATCAPQASFASNTFIRLRDPDRKLGFALVADAASYPGTTSDTGAVVPVDPLIRSQRLLTGGDIDIESLVIDADGNFWFGEEFGPFLVKTDRTGKVLQKETALINGLSPAANPLVQSPNNPYLGAGVANLPGSGGIESLAINPARTRIYTLLERELSTDTDKRRRLMNVFDIKTNAFLPTTHAYRVDTGAYVNELGATVAEVYTVNDITAINDHEFLVMEKDRGAGDARLGVFPAAGASRVAARFKKVFRVDLNVVDADGFLVKTEVVNLMALADNALVGGDATVQRLFTFPMESVETVHIVDSTTLLVANDNNYPGGAGSRNPAKVDDNEFVLIRLPVALNLQR